MLAAGAASIFRCARGECGRLIRVPVAKAPEMRLAIPNRVSCERERARLLEISVPAKIAVIAIRRKEEASPTVVKKCILLAGGRTLDGRRSQTSN
jgi:hypothetical protein